MKYSKLLRLAPLALVMVVLLGVGGKAHADYVEGNFVNNSLFLNNAALGATNSGVFSSGSGGAITAIQNFLNSEGAGIASGNFATTTNSGTDTLPNGQTSASAAYLIAYAAWHYGLSPQTIMATMQKEESLITDPSPASSETNFAMGYGCPDTSGCGSTYMGFYQQLMDGSWQLRFNYERANGNNGSWTSPDGNTWGSSSIMYACTSASTSYYTTNSASGKSGLYPGNTVQWLFNGSVYTSSVIANAASASLYCYTPHAYTSGKYSGSYNFVESWEAWWGETTPMYGWQVAGQYAYTDQTKTVGSGTVGMIPGQQVYVGVQALNTGNITWTNSGPNQVMLGTSSPQDRNSAFCDNWGYGCNRPSGMLESSVAPGQTATFEFWMKAPGTPGTYNEHFNVLENGVTWFPDQGLNFHMTVVPAVYSWQPAGQFAYTDSSMTTGSGTTGMHPGDTVFVGFSAKNTGNETWTNTGANPVDAGTSDPTDRNSAFCDQWGWGCNRPARLMQATVAPGQIGTFEFPMKAPSAVGNYSEHFNLVAEGITWMNDPGLNFYMTVVPAIYSWQPEGQFAYTDQTMTTGSGTTGLTPGQRVFIGFSALNTGNIVWKNSGNYPVNVGTTRPQDRYSAFYDASWLGPNRPAHMLQASVAPGQTGTFGFWVKAPSQAGAYREYFSLLAENFTWMNDPGVNFYITVQ